MVAAKKPKRVPLNKRPPTPRTEMVKTGRKPFQPTDDERKLVAQMSVAGITHEQQAAVIRGGIDAETLKKHFQIELTNSKSAALAKVAGTLYANALAGDTGACIFWLKTQGQWRETISLEHGGKDGGPIEYRQQRSDFAETLKEMAVEAGGLKLVESKN